MGWEDLGNTIAGGIDREGQFQQGRFRSAQTEDALTQARVNQAKAVEQENINAQRATLKAALAKNEMNFQDPTNQMLGDIMLGGLASDASQIGDFQNKAQQFRLRDKMANPDQSALARTRAGQALEGKPSSDLEAIGSKDFTNLTADTPTVAPLPGAAAASDGSEFGSPAGKLAADRRKMVQMFGEGSAQVAEFDSAASKLATAGGVPTWVQPFPGGPAPAQAPTSGPAPIFAPPSKPAVAPGTVAANTALTTNAKEVSKAQSKLQVALPGVQDMVDNFKASIDKFTASPGFTSVYGKSGAAWRMSPELFQGEDFRNSEVLLKNLNAQAFMQGIKGLRGLGPASDRESSRAETALTAAINPSQDEAHAKQLWDEFGRRLDELMTVAEQEAGVTVGGAAKSFNTEAEAITAGVKPGDRVIIGGQSGVWE